MENIVNNTYLSLIDRFKSKKILVIGDLILDVYFSGACTRISPEAPVPIVDVHNKKYCLGGAANVAANLRALGCQTVFCSVTGKDNGRDTALNLLKQANISSPDLLYDNQRNTLVKTRITTAEQCLIRIDEGTTDSISSLTERNLIAQIEKLYEDCDAVLIADYDKGIITQGLILALEKLILKKRKFIAVDSKKLEAFKKLKPDLIKPNYKEFIRLIGSKEMHENRIEQVRSAGKTLFDKCNAHMSAVTLDKEGVVLFCKGNFELHVPAQAVKSPHVSGAGDSFISALLLALLSNGNRQESVAIAMETAKIAIEKEDTSFCSKSELRIAFSKDTKAITSSSSLREISHFYHSQGKKIVFTNGCFDILHRGHIEYLNQAKKLGDILIVGINNDGSIKRLKGPDRPINNLLDRIEVLSALGCVDHVFSFGNVADDTPINLIELVRPHIFVKGGDYKDKIIPETQVLKECGSKIQFLPFVKNLSTSNIINKINNRTNLKIVKTG